MTEEIHSPLAFAYGLDSDDTRLSEPHTTELRNTNRRCRGRFEPPDCILFPNDLISVPTPARWLSYDRLT